MNAYFRAPPKDTVAVPAKGHAICCNAGDVKEFGFRPIPEDGNYTSHFSGDTGTPKTATGDPDWTPFSDSRPDDSASDLIDLGQDEGKEAQGADQEAVDSAISEADISQLQSDSGSVISTLLPCMLD